MRAFAIVPRPGRSPSGIQSSSSRTDTITVVWPRLRPIWRARPWVKTFHGSRPRSALTRAASARPNSTSPSSSRVARSTGRSHAPVIAGQKSRGPSPYPRGSRRREAGAVSKLAAIVLVLFAGLVTAAQAAPRDAVLVSRADGAAGAAASDVTFPASSISANGRYVAFASLADNLSDADDDAYSNIYVRDLQTRTTTYVSRASGSARPAHGFSARPSISADGRFVAFDFGRRQPERRGRRRVPRRLRTRPAGEHHDLREPGERPGRHAGRGGRQLVRHAVDLGRRALRRLHLGPRAT